MDLLSPDEAAERLGVTVGRIDQMVRAGELLAVRFVTGIKVVLDDSQPGAQETLEGDR